MMERRFKVRRKPKLEEFGKPDLYIPSSTIEKFDGGTISETSTSITSSCFRCCSPSSIGLICSLDPSFDECSIVKEESVRQSYRHCKVGCRPIRVLQREGNGRRSHNCDGILGGGTAVCWLGFFFFFATFQRKNYFLRILLSVGSRLLLLSSFSRTRTIKSLFRRFRNGLPTFICHVIYT